MQHLKFFLRGLQILGLAFGIMFLAVTIAMYTSPWVIFAPIIIAITYLIGLAYYA